MALVASTPEGRRLLEACEMHELGLDMMRARLRREQPHATTAEIEAIVRAWISDRPYDSPGRPVDLSSP